MKDTIICKCIKKFRNKQGKIIGYRLQDTKGQIKDVSTTDVKNAIKQCKINIINLQLTTNNRLIDKNTSSTSVKNDTRKTVERISEKAVPVVNTEPNIITEFLMKYLVNTGYYDENTGSYKDKNNVVSDRIENGKKIYKVLSKLASINIPNILYFNDDLYINTTRTVSSRYGEKISNECYKFSKYCSNIIYICDEYIDIADVYCDLASEINEDNRVIKAAFDGGGESYNEIIFTVALSDGSHKTYQVYEDSFEEYDIELDNLDTVVDIGNILTDEILKISSKLKDLVLLNKEINTKITTNNSKEIAFDTLVDKYCYSDIIKNLSLYIIESKKEITDRMIENLTLVTMLAFGIYH